MNGLLLALLLTQYPTGAINVRDEGVNKGKAIEVDCTGAGVTCTQSGWRWTINIPGGGGGGGAGLPADPAACAAGQYVYDQDINGVLACAQVAYSQVSGTPADLTAVPFVTTAASALLSAETVLPASCTGTQKLTWSGGVLTCSADVDAFGAFTPTDDTMLVGNGSVWQNKAIPSCAGSNDVMRYQPSGNTWGCSATMAQNGEPYLTTGIPSALSSYRRIVAGVSTSLNTSTSNQLAVDVVSPVASASALAANPANCGAGQAPLGVDAAGAAEGCFIPAGTYSLPALTSTVRGGVKGTGSALVCSGTDKMTGFDAAGALQCATDQTLAGGAYGTIMEEGAALTQRATVNFIGSSVTCVDNGGATRTDCTVTSAASAGGSNTQVQYNNATALGGISAVTSDGTNLVFMGTTTEPSAPAAGSLKFFAMQPHGTNSPVLPYWKGGGTQVDYRLFPEVLSTDPVWGCLQPAAFGVTTITPTGSMAAGTATGTAAAITWASTDNRTRAKWVQYPTTAAVNINAGLRAGVDYVWRGNAAGLGGFYVWGSMNIATGNAGQRVFMGLKDATAVLTAAADPNAALDTVYFGANAADTNLSICSNDNVGTATCATLGASYPAKTANSAYDIAFWTTPNDTAIGYSIRHVVSGATTTGTVSADLPRNTVQLGFDFNINSGTSAAITTMQFGGTCYIANP